LNKINDEDVDGESNGRPFCTLSNDDKKVSKKTDCFRMKKEFGKKHEKAILKFCFLTYKDFEVGHFYQHN
jgi:hypothetical protein